MQLTANLGLGFEINGYAAGVSSQRAKKNNLSGVAINSDWDRN
jgi:hypothetical protein